MTTLSQLSIRSGCGCIRMCASDGIQTKFKEMRTGIRGTTSNAVERIEYFQIAGYSSEDLNDYRVFEV